MLGKERIAELKEIVKATRRTIVTTICNAQAGHTGGSMSLVEICTVLYHEIMNIDPQNPRKPDRDRFVLSKGHSSCGLYAVLAHRGYFPLEKMCEFDRINGMLQGHPDMNKTPGIDISTGSLGQGLSAGIGMALGGAMRGLNFRTFVLMGDGEIQEGQVWEAAMYAGVHKVKNLIGIIDYNKVQLTGNTVDTLTLEPLAEKWKAFGWHVLECNGHDVEDTYNTIKKAAESKEAPVIIIAHTVKGHGVSFMCNSAAWHAKAPTKEELELALEELK